MRSFRVVPAVVALLLLPGAAAAAAGTDPSGQPLPKIPIEQKGSPFQAGFRLSIEEGGRVESSAGAVFVRHDGILCVSVDAPIHQRLAFGRQQLTIYYPDEKTVLVAKPGPGKLPVMIDALLLAFIDPSGLLTKNATVLSQTEDPAAHTLTTIWVVSDPSGKNQARMKLVEARDGTRSIEVLSKEGVLLNRYEFDGRVALGTAHIPTRITVTYKRTGKPDRVDRWTLDRVAAENDGSGAAQSCVAVPAGLHAREITL